MFTAWLSAMGLGALLAVPTSAHCALMCGPIAMHARGQRRALAYFVGRLVSYALLGSLAGAFGRTILELAPLVWLEAVASLSVAAVLVISALRLLRTKSAPRPLQISKKRKVAMLSRVFAKLVDEPLLLGAFTALLPCGALGAALLLAASTGHPVTGALAMSTFAVITGVGLVGAGVLSAKLTPSRSGRRALAALLIVGTVILVWRPLSGIGADRPSCHGEHHTENH